MIFVCQRFHCRQLSRRQDSYKKPHQFESCNDWPLFLPLLEAMSCSLWKNLSEIYLLMEWKLQIWTRVWLGTLVKVLTIWNLLLAAIYFVALKFVLRVVQRCKKAEKFTSGMKRNFAADFATFVALLPAGGTPYSIRRCFMKITAAGGFEMPIRLKKKNTAWQRKLQNGGFAFVATHLPFVRITLVLLLLWNHASLTNAGNLRETLQLDRFYLAGFAYDHLNFHIFPWKLLQAMICLNLGYSLLWLSLWTAAHPKAAFGALVHLTGGLPATATETLLCLTDFQIW